MPQPRPAVWAERVHRVAPAVRAAAAGVGEMGLEGVPGPVVEEEVMAVLPAHWLQAWEVMAEPRWPPITDFTPLIQALD